MLSVIHRLDVVRVQLFGQLAGIDPITLTAILEVFFRGLQTSTSVTWGFSKSCNQAAQVPSSKVTRKSPRSPSMNCRIVLALVSMTHSITSLPTEFLTAIEMLSVCTSMPIYLALVIKGCSFLEKFEQALKTYSKGAPSYNVFLLLWYDVGRGTRRPSSGQ